MCKAEINTKTEQPKIHAIPQQGPRLQRWAAGRASNMRHGGVKVQFPGRAAPSKGAAQTCQRGLHQRQVQSQEKEQMSVKNTQHQCCKLSTGSMEAQGRRPKLKLDWHVWLHQHLNKKQDGTHEPECKHALENKHSNNF